MNIIARKINRRGVIHILIIFSSAGLLIYSTWCGVGLTNDSLDYLRGGEVLASGGHFSELAYPANIVANGPLIPVVLSLLGNNARYYYSLISVLYLLITLFSFKYLIENIILHNSIKLWALIAISFGTPLIMVYNFLWTESAFMAVLSLIMVGVFLYIKSKKLAYIVLVGGLCFLLTLSRKAGLIFPAAIFFTLIVADIKVIKQVKFVGAMVISAGGYFLWRFYIMSFAGGAARITTPTESVHIFNYQSDYLSSLSLWLVPNGVDAQLRIFIICFLIITVLFVFGLVKSTLSEHVKAYSLLLLAIIVVYYMARSILERDLDEIDRYLSEIYPLSILFIGLVIDAAIRNIGSAKRLIIVILCFIWLIYPVTRTIKNAIFWQANTCAVQLNN